MPTLLLTVTNVLVFRDGRVLADPEFDHPTALGRVPVVLRRPDGSELATTASVAIAFVNRHPYAPPGKVCLFHGVSKGQIPTGTEVWLEADAADSPADRDG